MLYGWHSRKLNFATWVIDSLGNGKRISVAEDHYNSPTLADNLAEMILGIAKMDVTGVYHTAGSERISRYKFALKIAEAFNLDRTLVTPVRMKDIKVWIARRPADSSLCVDKVRREVELSPPSLNDALERMKSGMRVDGPHDGRILGRCVEGKQKESSLHIPCAGSNDRFEENEK